MLRREQNKVTPVVAGGTGGGAEENEAGVATVTKGEAVAESSSLSGYTQTYLIRKPNDVGSREGADDEQTEHEVLF